MNAILKNEYSHRDRLVSANLEIHPNLSATSLLTLTNRLYGPERKEIRRLLLAMRRELRWSQGFLAAVLGVPLITYRRWEKGTRNPSGAARKFIWFLHDSLLCGSKKARTAWDLATWGEMNMRYPDDQMVVAPTYTVPEAELFDHLTKLVAAKIAEAERASNADEGQQSEPCAAKTSPFATDPLAPATG